MDVSTFFESLPSIKELAPVPQGAISNLDMCMTHCNCDCNDCYCDCKCDGAKD